jgi:hypothetical protein
VNGIRPDGVNWALAGDLLDELLLNQELRPGMGAIDGGTFIATTSQTSVVNFPNGVQSSWKVPMLLRAPWRRAGVYFKIWYTSDVGSTAAFALSTSISPFGVGDVLGALTNTHNVAHSLAGPAAANEIKEYEYVDTSTGVVVANKPGMSVRLTRTDPDANANALRIILVQLKIRRSFA